MADLRKARWGWMAFDWAQQPIFTLGLTFIFAPYFVEAATALFAAQGHADPQVRAQSLWSGAQSLTGLVIALTAPLLGIWLDRLGHKKRWALGAAALFSLSSAFLWGLYPDGTGLYAALTAFCLALLAAEIGQNITNAMLPSLGTSKEISRLSGSGAALGYWGGVVSLLIMLGFFVEQANGKTLLGLAPPFGLESDAREGTRMVGPFIALWNVLFLLPFLFWVPNEPKGARTSDSTWLSLKASLKRTFKSRSTSAFLLSSMLYRDAMNAIYAFGGVYAALVLGWPIVKVGVFGIISAIAAAIITWLAGLCDARLGPKPVIVAACWALIAICLLIICMTPSTLFGLPLAAGQADLIFMASGTVIGGAGGAIYSASRSLMSRHTTPETAGEAFGLFALSGRATAFLAPALISGATLLTGSLRLGFAPVIGLFLIALLLLAWVNPKGDRA